MLISLLVGLILINPLAGTMAEPAVVDLNLVERRNPPQRINPENVGLILKAERYAAIDTASGRMLIGHNADEPQAIASITKLATALVILDQKPDWEKRVEMSEQDETVGAYPDIYRGETVLFQDLWYAALVGSDNNAIMAMIRALGFGKNDFVQAMNAKARELKMYNSIFTDPTGLDENNRSTALDVAKLLQSALAREEISRAVLTEEYEFQILESKYKSRDSGKVKNTDILLDSFLNEKQYGYEFLGGKTGFTDEAGYCLGVKTQKDGHEIIAVVLRSNSIKNRFQDIKALTDWVFSNYNWR